MHAVRNIRLCTKDCLCLYVCPSGATDTETGQIDAVKCISGCRACVDACPSHAISLIPDEFPPQQGKSEAVINALRSLANSKIKQERIAEAIADTTDNPILQQLATAISKSNRLMTEDLLRESGYMLPQSNNVRELLSSLLKKEQPDDFPFETVKSLIHLIDQNSATAFVRKKEEEKMERYRCSVCGYIHEGPLSADFKCPVCKQPASAFEKIEETKTHL